MLIEPLFVQQIVDMYSAGKSQKEIVETIGQTYHVVRYWLKKKGLYDPNRRQSGKVHATQGLKRSNEKSRQEAETRLAFSLLGKGFVYLGGYNTKKDSEIRLSCLHCGKEFVRHDLHWLLNGNIECPFCGDTAKRIAERKRIAEEKHREWEQQQELYKQKRVAHELEVKNRIDEVRVCKECGCLYTYRSYAQSIGVDPIHVQRVDCCSRECLKKQKRKDLKKYNKAHHGERSHIKRAKKFGCEFERGVTLQRLIKRDGLRCAICGDFCDLNDRSYGNGNGPFYPSMDHIVPLSKGGSHTWNNVQVAHIICNTLKNNKVG